MYCPNCGKEVIEQSKFCKFCGNGMPDTSTMPAQGVSECVNQPYAVVPQAPQTQLVQQPQVQMPSQQERQINITVDNTQPYYKSSNGIGTAGFVLALIGFFFGLIPIIGSIIEAPIWILGVIFSIIGLFGQPKGLAIAGTIISFVDLILDLLLFGGIIFASMV